MAAVETAAESADRDSDGGPRHLVIVGGGEHARVVADAVRASPEAWTLIGFTEREGVESDLDAPRLGADTDVAAALHAGEKTWLVLGFGGPASGRREAIGSFGVGARWATIVDPSATISPSASIAAGAVILAHAVVNAGATIGGHAIVNTGAVVEHDVRVGEHAHLAPGAVVGGGARIGDDAFVGLGAVVRDHVTIGARATVGMGSAVVSDVPEDAVVTGVPARPQAPPSRA